MSTVILEIGRCFIRIGYNKETTPRNCISTPSCISIDKPTQLSREAIMMFLQHVFVDLLRIKPKEYRLLIIESAFTLQALRECIFEICLRDLQFHSISVQVDIFLPILASGKGSGIVVDIGYDCCRVIAIADERPLLHTLHVSKCGIKELQHELCDSLSFILNKSVPLASSSFLLQKISNLDPNSFELFPDINSLNIEEISELYIDIPPSSDVSNTNIKIPKSNMDAIFAILFSGLSRYRGFVDENGGLVGAVINCLQSCNIDFRSKIVQNIIICGGGSMIPHMKEVLCKQISYYINNQDEYASLRSICDCFPNKEFHPSTNYFPSDLLTFIGASCFASLRSNDIKFVKLKDVIVKRNTTADSLMEDEITDTQVKLTYDIRVPDWMSIFENDWKFFGPSMVTTKHGYDEQARLMSKRDSFLSPKSKRASLQLKRQSMFH